MIPWQQLAELPVFAEFYRLIRKLFDLDILLADPDYHTFHLLGPGRQRKTFCDALHRQPEVLHRCIECDASHARRVAQMRLPSRYRCHAGLTEFIIPILMEGEVVAHLVCGRVLDHVPTAADWRRLRRRFPQKGCDSQRLWNAYRQSPVIPVKTQQALVALLQLFAHLAATYAQLGVPDQDPPRRIMSQALVFLKKRFREGVRISELATAVGASQRNLLRLFRARTGLTVMAHLQRLRIDYACRRLQETQETILQVALDSGFGSIQQFNRVFRMFMGDTPSSWRERARRVHCP